MRHPGFSSSVKQTNKKYGKWKFTSGNFAYMIEWKNLIKTNLHRSLGIKLKVFSSHYILD